MDLNDLYDLSEKNHIKMDSFKLTASPSFAMDYKGRCYVVMDPSQFSGSADEKVKVAHELGHCCQGAFYNRYSPLDTVEKQERRADCWAIKKLIPREELKTAADSGCGNVYEFAEYFGVTEDFMRLALEYYLNVEPME